MTTPAEPAAQFTVDEVSPSYWRVTLMAAASFAARTPWPDL
jgi:hypothetical protein